MIPELNQEHGAVDRLVSGDMITWLSPDHEHRALVQRGPTMVDALHVDPDGIVWVFVTLPGNCFAAVNVKHVKRIDQK